MILFTLYSLLLSSLLSVSAFATLPKQVKTPILADQLSKLRNQVDSMEQELLATGKVQKSARVQFKRVQKLLNLQKLQKQLGEKRVQELESTVNSLDLRRKTLREKIAHQQRTIVKLLTAIESSHRGDSIKESETSLELLHLPQQEKLEAPRRKAMGNLVDHSLKEVEALKIDLADAAQLETRIQDEKQQIVYLFHDLSEQESVLELNRQLQLEILKKNKKERLNQLENYRKLKKAESQVEHLMIEFNARLELQQSIETEKVVSRSMHQGNFSKLKGKLPFPVVGGKVITLFGRGYDSQSGLHVFKKGIDISAQKNQTVRAISSGKIAYSGELPNYGRVVIIDHGGHFYSLSGHLGVVFKNSNDWVASGDSIGQTDNSGIPLYFEIRSRNVAVNPLQWVLN